MTLTDPTTTEDPQVPAEMIEGIRRATAALERLLADTPELIPVLTAAAAARTTLFEWVDEQTWPGLCWDVDVDALAGVPALEDAAAPLWQPLREIMDAVTAGDERLQDRLWLKQEALLDAGFAARLIDLEETVARWPASVPLEIEFRAARLRSDVAAEPDDQEADDSFYERLIVLEQRLALYPNRFGLYPPAVSDDADDAA